MFAVPGPARPRRPWPRGWLIVLVEQSIKAALGIAGRAYVMKSGRIVLERRARELLAAETSWWETY